MTHLRPAFLPPLVVLATSFSCLAETPGRLFFTPEERKPKAPPVAAVGDPEIGRMDGFVITAAGKQIHWRDGQAAEAQAGMDGESSPSPTQIGDSRLAPLLPEGSVTRHTPAPRP